MKQSVIDEALKTHYDNWVDNCYQYLLLAHKLGRLRDKHLIKNAPFKKYWEEGVSPIAAADIMVNEWYPE